MRTLFERTVSAICYSLVRDFFRSEPLPPAAHCNHVVRFVLGQHGAAPVFLRAPLRMCTLLFSWHCFLKTGRLFHQHDPVRRAEHLRVWKSSALGPQRSLVRFFESLAVLAWFGTCSGSAQC